MAIFRAHAEEKSTAATKPRARQQLSPEIASIVDEAIRSAAPDATAAAVTRSVEAAAAAAVLGAALTNLDVPEPWSAARIRFTADGHRRRRDLAAGLDRSGAKIVPRSGAEALPGTALVTAIDPTLTGVAVHPRIVMHELEARDGLLSPVTIEALTRHLEGALTARIGSTGSAATDFVAPVVVVVSPGRPAVT